MVGKKPWWFNSSLYLLLTLLLLGPVFRIIYFCTVKEVTLQIKKSFNTEVSQTGFPFVDNLNRITFKHVAQPTGVTAMMSTNL